MAYNILRITPTVMALKSAHIAIFVCNEQLSRKTIGRSDGGSNIAAAAVAAGNFRSIGDKRRKPLWTLLSYLTLSRRRDTSVATAGYSRPVIQKRPINAQRDARPPFRDGKSFGAYTLFTPRVTRAMRKFREIRQIVPLACAAHA